MDSPPPSEWPGSFERDTLIFELGVLARSLIPPAVAASAHEGYDAVERGHPLLEYEVSSSARITVHHVDAERYVFHVLHPEFEVVLQAVATENGHALDALRVASLRGDPMTALVWCRVLAKRERAPFSSDDTLDRGDDTPVDLD